MSEDFLKEKIEVFNWKIYYFINNSAVKSIVAIIIEQAGTPI